MGVIDDLEGVLSPYVGSLNETMLNENLALIDDFKSRPVSSPWTGLPRGDVATRLQALVRDPNVFNQDGLALCALSIFPLLLRPCARSLLQFWPL